MKVRGRSGDHAPTLYQDAELDHAAALANHASITRLMCSVDIEDLYSGLVFGPGTYILRFLLVRQDLLLHMPDYNAGWTICLDSGWLINASIPTWILIKGVQRSLQNGCKP